MINKQFSILFMIILCIPIVFALKGSIGNVRAVMYVNATPENPAVLYRSILVNNRNDIDVKVTVGVDEAYASWVDITDKEFILKPNESKQAKYKVTIEGGGTFEIKFNIAFSPADPDIKENSVGLLSVLTVVSTGPPIEVPENNEEPPEITPEEQPTGEIKNPFEPNNNTVTVSLGNKPQTTIQTKETGTSPFTGIIITVSIIIVGLVIYFLVTKKR
jgi:hypothetical protein